jgi:hypothetical protein
MTMICKFFAKADLQIANLQIADLQIEGGLA